MNFDMKRRCRNCTQKSPNGANSPSFYSSTLRCPFSQCPSSNLLRGSPDLGRAFSSFSIDRRQWYQPLLSSHLFAFLNTRKKVSHHLPTADRYEGSSC